MTQGTEDINRYSLTASCPVAALEVGSEKARIYERIYRALRSQFTENEFVGIQLYPAGWPRKVLVTMKDKELKNKLCIEGIDFDGLHLEFADEGEQIVKVIVKDAPVEIDYEEMVNMFSPYGKVIRVEDEYLKIDGVITTCKTGNRSVFFSSLDNEIPSTLPFDVGGRTVNVSIWYKGMGSWNPRKQASISCNKCGSAEHQSKACSFSTNVCYHCKEAGHSKRECRKNDGSRINDQVHVFLSHKCPLSNSNADFKFQHQGETFSSVEQLVTFQKCQHFNDNMMAEEVLLETDPKEIRHIGSNIEGYDHETWKEIHEEVLMEGLRAKFSSNKEAQEYLVSTGDKVIGEGSSNLIFGIGIHISDEKVLSVENWTGANILGKLLMEIREQIKQHRALQQSQITEISNLIQTGESPGTAPPHQRHASDSNSVSLAENQNEEEDSEGSVMVESS